MINRKLQSTCLRLIDLTRRDGKRFLIFRKREVEVSAAVEDARCLKGVVHTRQKANGEFALTGRCVYIASMQEVQCVCVQYSKNVGRTLVAELAQLIQGSGTSKRVGFLRRQRELDPQDLGADVNT
jgi:hypothetical protein